MEIRPITHLDTLDLRKRLLRPCQCNEELLFPGDLDQDTLHAGAFDDGTLVGIVTVLREIPAENTTCPDPWRIRGMAVEAHLRGKGIGKQLIQTCEAHVRSHQSSHIWCYARTPAIPFYESCDYSIAGPVFSVPEAGPHQLMWKLLQ